MSSKVPQEEPEEDDVAHLTRWSAWEREARWASWEKLKGLEADAATKLAHDAGFVAGATWERERAVEEAARKPREVALREPAPKTPHELFRRYTRETWRIGDLVALLRRYPDDGEVWLATGRGLTSPLRDVTPLNTSDVALEPAGSVWENLREETAR